ncbi:nuclease [Halieaceae bacterium IMCC14734]|uniref:Nuclease n=1 Tax=Candidatus Litorirhabdus singularis TaxID=2518993 RepID=A0ABT3TM39_9GAMM|nr:thermonuclease family protein [Candidatus Litorirhabdus singularis]MCX2983394.1 nuclease [Candidatus Litorirhabdus singularis]
MSIIRAISLVALVIAANQALADITGRVVAVTDGDTIKVLDANNNQHKIRLTGIDAPEKNQAFGNASRKNLNSLLAGKQVRVESDKTDRYGRVLGKVWVQPSDCPSCGKTLDANYAQVFSGMAWWYRYYAKDQSAEDRGRYESAEDEARKRKRGLWVDANPVAPWDFRRGGRDTKVSDSDLPAGCGSKRYCKEMNSCEEAKFYLTQCGRSSLDGNNDGIPCNSLCK